jgi:hypothetical protein
LGCIKIIDGKIIFLVKIYKNQYFIMIEIIGPGLHTIIYDNSFLSFEILARKQWLLIDHGILKIFGLHQNN